MLEEEVEDEGRREGGGERGGESEPEVSGARWAEGK